MFQKEMTDTSIRESSGNGLSYTQKSAMDAAGALMIPLVLEETTPMTLYC